MGALGALFGIGGGLFAIPLLGIVFHLDQQHAQGTAIAMVAPNVFAAMWAYSKYGGFDKRVGIVMGATAVPLTFVGALLAVHAPSVLLRHAFAGFMLALALWFALQALRARRGPAAPARFDWRWTALVGALGGVVSGIFSVGGAVVAVPILSTLFGFGQAAAQGTALALVAPGLLVSIVTYALAGDVDWSIGIPLALGGMLCVRYGVALAHRLPERVLRLLFSGFLVVTGVLLFASA